MKKYGIFLAFLFWTGFLMAQSPNFVFILVDDQAWNGTEVQMDLNHSTSGSDYYQTTAIQMLASQGMSFSNAYAPAAKCSPSRNSILTGQVPGRSQFTNTSSKVEPGKLLNKP